MNDMFFRRSPSEIWRSLKTDFAEAYQRTEQRKNFAIIAIAAAAVLAADQITKAVAVRWETTFLNTGNTYELDRIAPWFPPALTSAITFMFIAAMLWAAISARMPTLSFSAGLIIAAGIGNQTDRIFRGGVVDWLPAPALDGKLLKANIADLAAVAAIAVFAAAIVQINIGIHKNRKRAALPV